MSWILRLFNLLGGIFKAWRKQYEAEVDAYEKDSEKQNERDTAVEEQQMRTDRRIEEIKNEAQAKHDAVDGRSDRDVLRDLDL